MLPEIKVNFTLAKLIVIIQCVDGGAIVEFECFTTHKNGLLIFFRHQSYYTSAFGHFNFQ